MAKTDELKDQARHLIVEQLKAAEMRQGCTDYAYYADVLLRQLEPVIFAYAPPPDRIIQALKWGCQAPGPA